MLSDKELKAKISNRIRECREEKGLTQTELGEILGKAKTTIASWEQGKSSPEATTLYKLSICFGKTLSYMYGEEDK